MNFLWENRNLVRKSAKAAGKSAKVKRYQPKQQNISQTTYKEEDIFSFSSNIKASYSIEKEKKNEYNHPQSGNNLSAS